MNSISIEPDGTGTVTIDGHSETIEANSYPAAQNEAINLLVFHAQQADDQLKVSTNDPEAPLLVVSPTGEVNTADHATNQTAEPAPQAPAEPTSEWTTAALDQPNETSTQHQTSTEHETTAEHETNPEPASPPADPALSAEPPGHQPQQQAQPPAGAAGANPLLGVGDEATGRGSATRRDMRAQRESFLTQEHREEPATEGWRGVLSSMGIRSCPSDAEKARRADRKTVSQHWPGPRTIAVVNGKGGANKTPTTVLLSAVFARYGGGGVLAYDNNQTRGTLGWRTEQGPHQATILDLLPKATDLLATGAQSADLAHYVHHQSSDRYDVLRSKPVALADEQRINADDVDAIHQVASKFYRLIFIDSGNDESDPLWKRMIDLSDQLVVATTTKDEHAEAGALLLEALADRDDRSAALADDAVVVVSESNNSAKPTEAQDVQTGFSTLAREVVTIPHDPAMVDGLLRYDALRKPTQQAWLRAAAAIARGL